MPPADRTDEALPEPERKAAFLLRLRAKGIRNVAVLRAMETVPRRRFLASQHMDFADRDMALPIGCGQTTPEPFEVARLLEALSVEPHHRVLEVGTGAGYLTALLAQLGSEIISIERFQSLALEAQARLATDGHTRATVLWADGLAPAPELGLFDRIAVTAALQDPPAPLLERMTPDGCLVFPNLRTPELGPILVRVRRDAGVLVHEELWPCRAQAAIPARSREL